MSYVARAEIDKRTFEAIQVEHNPFDGAWYRCGCHPHPKRPWEAFALCSYHDGYDDGLHAVRPSVEGDPTP